MVSRDFAIPSFELRILLKKPIQIIKPDYKSKVQPIGITNHDQQKDQLATDFEGFKNYLLKG